MSRLFNTNFRLQSECDHYDNSSAVNNEHEHTPYELVFGQKPRSNLNLLRDMPARCNN